MYTLLCQINVPRPRLLIFSNSTPSPPPTRRALRLCIIQNIPGKFPTHSIIKTLPPFPRLSGTEE